MNSDFKYNEPAFVQELMEYIEDTYEGHYSNSKLQAAEVIFDSGHGVGFTIGNIMKYAQRYGKKGNSIESRKDLMKVLHYGIMALYLHDSQNENSVDFENDKKLDLRMEKK